MKKIQISLLLLLLQTLVYSQQINRKVVFVIADGIPADVIEKISKPQLDQIIQKGFYKKAFVGGIRGNYNQTPTISAPGYNNLLTGTWSNKHHVLDNDIKEPNYQYWTIFRYLKHARPSAKTAIFSSWKDNRTKLIGEGLTQTGGYKLDLAFDGYELDTIRFPHDRQKLYSHLIDEQVVNMADSCIRAVGPDLSWVYLEYTDDMGHAYGDAPPFIQAVQYLDEQMGRLYQAIRYRKEHFNEEWLMVITTDHGRDAKTGMHHGGQSDRERNTWIISNYASPNVYAQGQHLAIVDILPSIASFLKIKIPEPNRSELDGVSFIDPVSIANAQVELFNDTLHIRWKPIENSGRVKITYTNTNHFRTGGRDSFHRLANVPIKNGQYLIPLNRLHENNYRFLLKARHNAVNTEWSNQKK